MALFNVKDFKCIPSDKLKVEQETIGSKVWLIKPYDKFSCYDEDGVYELEQKLNDIGCTTRVGRNAESDTLSVVILSTPNDQCLVIPEIKIVM